MSTARQIRLRVQLAGGHTCEATLREDAAELRTLYAALASPTPANDFIQLPLDGGRSACSFRASQLVSIVSEPPVVIEPRTAETVAQPGTQRESAPHSRLRRPRYLIIDDFLCPAEHTDMLVLATASEQRFTAGTVAGQQSEHRQNLVIPSFGDSAHARLIQNRVLVWYPVLAKTLGVPVVPLGMVESQLTAARGRQFYRVHADLGPDCPRELSCIYYMHRQPRGFAGGELRLYDCIEQGGQSRPAGSFEVVAPISNRLVVFPSGEFHEAMPVRCPSGEFADSRFAITTWLHRAGQPDPEARFGWGHFRCGVVAPQFACSAGEGASVS
jgi:Rps23 Pro-64 3,4-dihydroxylase Tpa1-like proline 4-hydroxylase